MILLAILTGILAALTIRRTTNASALRTTTRRIHASLLEFRLYFDEPLFIWRAWMNLLRDNLRLILLFLPGMLILALPVTWLMLHLDATYGHRPLHPGEAAVVTARLGDHLDLQCRTGAQVDSPPVRIPRDNQVAWRIRATGGPVEVTLNGVPLAVDYPKSDAAIPWQVWFVVISTAAATASAVVVPRASP
jgi:hypothetical protein